MKNKITTKAASLEVIIHRHRFTFLYHQIQNFKRGENIFIA